MSQPDVLHSLPGPLLLAPFVLQLLAIALMPLLAHHWWERHYPKVSVILGGSTVLYYLLILGRGGRLIDPLHEYISFVVIMAALFIVAGGIHIRVSGEATPWKNVLFLLIGSVLASVIGTTGASMLLVRPWVRMNRYRITGFHTAFFIFLIANVGGGLTPIGDPPLFLGFLKGVPFWWTLEHLWRPWLLVVGLLVGIFYFIDRENFLRAPRAIREEETAEEHWAFEGLGNLLPLVAILSAVFSPSPWREIVMVAAAFLSWHLTPRLTHEKNDFTFAPIKEVAWLFLGIFATMVPALDYLEHHASQLAGALGMGSVHFYYMTGILSSFLDNAPTYLAFLSVELGLQGGTLGNPQDVLRIATQDPKHLIAISMGAVFFGAMTYIGNGPNFMVKSIVAQFGARPPGFFGYILYYALPILLPVLVLAGWLFLR
ncbi:MAG: sodium:proton antiporter [Chthoniobacterales bacterium]|jgi:Na+/H+ antiporter NhaD/arsenite permease-like protein